MDCLFLTLNNFFKLSNQLFFSLYHQLALFIIHLTFLCQIPIHLSLILLIQYTLLLFSQHLIHLIDLFLEFFVLLILLIKFVMGFLVIFLEEDNLFVFVLELRLKWFNLANLGIKLEDLLLVFVNFFEF